MTTPQVLTVFMTAPDGDVAERIASTLVEERLAACANVVREVVSVYRWEGVLALPVVDGHEPYLSWVRGEVS